MGLLLAGQLDDGKPLLQGLRGRSVQIDARSATGQQLEPGTQVQLPLFADLVLEGTSGRLVSIRKGVYDNVSLEVVNGPHKVIDTYKYYNKDRLRPNYTFNQKPLFIMTGDL